MNDSTYAGYDQLLHNDTPVLVVNIKYLRIALVQQGVLLNICQDTDYRSHQPFRSLPCCKISNHENLHFACHDGRSSWSCYDIACCDLAHV
jgi:hypothetical protein